MGVAIHNRQVKPTGSSNVSPCSRVEKEYRPRLAMFTLSRLSPSSQVLLYLLFLSSLLNLAKVSALSSLTVLVADCCASARTYAPTFLGISGMHRHWKASALDGYSNRPLTLGQ